MKTKSGKARKARLPGKRCKASRGPDRPGRPCKALAVILKAPYRHRKYFTPWVEERYHNGNFAYYKRGYILRLTETRQGKGKTSMTVVEASCPFCGVKFPGVIHVPYKRGLFIEITPANWRELHDVITKRPA